LKGEKARFKDDLDEVLIKTMDTGTIPEYFKDKVASEEHDFHLTVTKKERDRLAKICSKRYCDKLPKNQVAVCKDMHYGVGMEVKCTNNINIPRGGEVKNKRVYRITHVDGDGLIKMVDVDRDLPYWVEVHQLYNNFIGNFASTIDGIQGAKIEKSFSIWEMNHKMFNLNRLNSAMGRSIRKDLIHFSNPSSEIRYKWQVYPLNVTAKSKPMNTDERYKHTNFYLVSFELEGIRYYYRGHTVNSASWRLNEHFTSATQNPSSKFHRKLALSAFDKVTIQITETGSFSCRAGAEMHEMHLLEQDLKKYNMLNIRHRKKEVKEIQVCDTKQISKEDFKKYQEIIKKLH
jgi:hypothetical protein